MGQVKEIRDQIRTENNLDKLEEWSPNRARE